VSSVSSVRSHQSMLSFGLIAAGTYSTIIDIERLYKQRCISDAEMPLDDASRSSVCCLSRHLKSYQLDVWSTLLLDDSARSMVIDY
jgi:hypothetical protein